MKPWEEVASDPLAFPIRGKNYTVPEMPYDDWLTIQQIQSGKVTELEGPAEETWRLVLGSAWDEMVADNVPAEALSRAGLAALTFVQFGREMAESVWEAGLDPKAVAAAIVERQSSTSTSTASAPETPSLDSSTPTTSRKGSSRKKRGNASLSATSRQNTGR